MQPVSLFVGERRDKRNGQLGNNAAKITDVAH